MHWAADNDRTDVAELLIRSGADIHLKDKVSSIRYESLTAHCCFYYQRVVKLLLIYACIPAITYLCSTDTYF